MCNAEIEEKSNIKNICEQYNYNCKDCHEHIEIKASTSLKNESSIKLLSEEMTINKTTDYFKMTAEEASKQINEYDTREEAKVLDSGLEHFFFETLEGLTKEYNSEERKAYTNKKDYEVLLFEFVADNSNHNKYCMVFV